MSVCRKRMNTCLLSYCMLHTQRTKSTKYKHNAHSSKEMDTVNIAVHVYVHAPAMHVSPPTRLLLCMHPRGFLEVIEGCATAVMRVKGC